MAIFLFAAGMFVGIFFGAILMFYLLKQYRLDLLEERKAINQELFNKQIDIQDPWDCLDELEMPREIDYGNF